MANTDIVLIGLGPTGAVLANLLGARGWKIKVFESAPAIYDLPRAVHFDDEVMRVFQAIGLSKEIEAVSNKVKGMDMINPEGALLARYIAPEENGPIGWHQGYMFYQPQVEALLRRGLQRYPNVSVHLGTEVVAIEEKQGAKGVEVEVADAQGKARHYARFAIGCCGARSVTRGAMHSGQKDFQADQRWLVVDIRLLRDVQMPDVTVQYCEPLRPSTYVPTPGNLRRFELMVMPGENPEDLLIKAKIAQLLDRWLSPEDYVVERAALYTFHALIAKKWREGPILIAGDAAHQMPPFLGQGMCSGIKDAANLFWKIDYVLRGIATEALLDTYQDERAAHIETVIRADLWLGSVIQTTDPTVAQQRDKEMLSGDQNTQHLTPPVVPLGGDLCKPEAPARLPFIQPVLPQGVLHDETLGEGFALLGSIKPSLWAQNILSRLSTQFEPNPAPAICAWLAATNARAVLVRPDRYVMALVSDEQELDHALRPLARYIETN